MAAANSEPAIQNETFKSPSEYQIEKNNDMYQTCVKLVREMIWYLVNDGLTKCTDEKIITMIQDSGAFFSKPSYTMFRQIIYHILSIRKELSMQNALYSIPKEEENKAITHIIGYVMEPITIKYGLCVMP